MASTMPYDPYKSLTSLAGDKTTAAGGFIPPQPPPSVNAAPAGAPTQAKPVAYPGPANPTTTPVPGMPPITSTAPTPAAPTTTPTAAAPAPKPSGPAAPAGPAFGTDIESRINGFLEKLMSGEGTPFNDSVMGKLRGRLFSAANGQADTAIAQAKDDAVRRGMFRSGIPTDAILAARAQAGQNYTKGEADLESQATQANSNQRLQAVQNLIQQLQASRQFNVQERQLAQSGQHQAPDYNGQLLQLISGMDSPEF